MVDRITKSLSPRLYALLRFSKRRIWAASHDAGWTHAPLPLLPH